MRQWSPDEFAAEIASVAHGATATLAAPFESSQDFDSDDIEFVEDFPRDGIDGFLRRLSLDERELLFQVVGVQVRAEVEAELAEKRRLERIEEDAALRALKEQLVKQTDDELHSVARQAMELSIAIAEQVLRREVSLDRTALLKSIETIIFRAERGTKFKLLAHPADVAVLREHEETLKELNIIDVNADRRIERGGCIVSADGREWDYTLGGRFETLVEVVRNAMADGGGAEGVL